MVSGAGGNSTSNLDDTSCAEDISKENSSLPRGEGYQLSTAEKVALIAILEFQEEQSCDSGAKEILSREMRNIANVEDSQDNTSITGDFEFDWDFEKSLELIKQVSQGTLINEKQHTITS